MAMNALETGVFLYLWKRTGVAAFVFFLLFCGLLCVLMVGIASTGGKSASRIPLEKATEMQKDMVRKHAPEYAQPAQAEAATGTPRRR